MKERAFDGILRRALRSIAKEEEQRKRGHSSGANGLGCVRCGWPESAEVDEGFWTCPYCGMENESEFRGASWLKEKDE